MVPIKLALKFVHVPLYKVWGKGGPGAGADLELQKGYFAPYNKKISFIILH